MENKKEPLMSAEQYYHKLDAISYAPLSFAKSYAKYHTQWHLNNAKEFVANNSDISVKKKSNFGKYRKWQNCTEEEVDLFSYEMKYSVDKQSIHTAIDNYIEINLKK